MLVYLSDVHASDGGHTVFPALYNVSRPHAVRPDALSAVSASREAARDELNALTRDPRPLALTR